MTPATRLFGYDADRHWRLRAVSHHITWFLGTRFPRAIPMVFVVGYPKSGTTWVCHIVADYLRLPFPQYSILPVGCPAVVHGHQRASKRFGHCVYVMRDGRDAMVSKFFHLLRRFEIPEGENPRLTKSQRRVFPKMTNRDRVAENLPAFLELQMERPQFVKINWSDHVNSFFDARHDRMVCLKYEDLLQSPAASFAAAMEALTATPSDPERARESLDRFSFDRMAGRRPGQEDRSSFLRKGKAGDWRNHFTRESAEIFNRYCGEALIRAGYEPDTAWVADC